MRRRWKHIVFLSVAIGCLLICGACGKSNVLRFGTGGIGGSYYACGNAMTQILEENLDLKVEVKTTAGSAANLRLLRDGFLQMAIVQSDTLSDAVNGEGSFADDPCDTVRAVAGLYTEECQIIVPADSEIETVGDLYRKRVSIGELDSGVMRNAEQILLAAGLTTDMIDVENLSFADAAAAMEAGEIDAFFCTAGAPTTAVAELARQMNIRVLSLDDGILNSVLRLYPGYFACTIPAGTYQGQDADVQTLGVKAVLVADKTVSDDDVQKMMSALFDYADQLQYSTGVHMISDIEFATENISVDFHSGARQYYEEHGIKVSEEVTE